MKIPVGLILLSALLTGCTVSHEDPVAAEPAACTIEVSKQERRICTMQYDPVCGCNGKTYGNACTAKGSGVQRFRPGSCEDNDQTPD